VSGKTIARLSDGYNMAGPRRTNTLLQELTATIEVYDLPECDLSVFHGLLIGTNIDQEFLYTHRDVIASFLDDGKVVTFSGHLLREWLPGAGLFVPRPINNHHDYDLTIVPPVHPVFEGVLDADITLQRGVAGFFARGHNPPPRGARVVVTLPDGEAAVYEDRVTTRGAMLVHSGNDMIGFGGGVPSTATCLTPQLLDWVDATYAELQAARKSEVPA
jgi:hypothetical protein